MPVLMYSAKVWNFGYVCHWLHGPVAQRLEQATHNRLVLGSNPSRPTILSRHSSFNLSVRFVRRHEQLIFIFQSERLEIDEQTMLVRHCNMNF